MSERRTGQTRVRMRSVDGGRGTSHIDLLATEEPMEIRMRSGGETRPIAVTMRTPGADFELAAGFLFAEGLVHSRHDIARIEYCLECEDAEQRYNIVTVVERMAKGKRQRAKDEGDGERSSEHESDASPLSLSGARTVTSACGLCGKERLEDIERRGIAPLPSGPVIGWQTIVSLPDQLRDAQGLFSTTGGLHAAALFTAEGELLAVREDVGRHNAVDKVIGWALLEGVMPLERHVLMVSGGVVSKSPRKRWWLESRPCAVSAPSSSGGRSGPAFRDDCSALCVATRSRLRRESENRAGSRSLEWIVERVAFPIHDERWDAPLQWSSTSSG
ncbi:MAG: formate dehydrogenase accessory sulfurtransferase FdhD [Thermomicrobiales bacterium]